MGSHLIWQTIATGPEQTELLGELLGSQLKAGQVIELRSDLGGGKTTFLRGLARGAGSKHAVASPTFTLSRIYQAPGFQIYHFDFYRLNDPGILADQLAESINDNRAVVVVEWADIVQNVLPEERLSIEFEPTANSSQVRKITIGYSEKYRNLITKLETDWTAIEP